MATMPDRGSIMSRCLLTHFSVNCEHSELVGCSESRQLFRDHTVTVTPLFYSGTASCSQSGQNTLKLTGATKQTHYFIDTE